MGYAWQSNLKTVFGSNKSICKPLWLCAASLVIAAGCAAPGSRTVSEADKDPDGSFDGVWIASVQKAPKIQYAPGNWQMNCSGEAYNFRMPVRESVARLTVDEKPADAYVGKNGNFGFSILRDFQAQASGNSDSSLDRGAVKLIITGSLKSGNGKITNGIEEFNYQGCTSKIKFSKDS